MNEPTSEQKPSHQSDAALPELLKTQTKKGKGSVSIHKMGLWILRETLSFDPREVDGLLAPLLLELPISSSRTFTMPLKT